MHISSVSIHHLCIPFRSPFTHALKSRRNTETVIVAVASSDGEIGFGEVLPRPYLTGETIQEVLEHELPALARAWLGRTFTDTNEVADALRQQLRQAERALAAVAGWELAVLDLAGKCFCFCAGEVIGPELKPALPVGAVIDFGFSTQALDKHCKCLRLAGVRHVKVKVGQPDDVRRLEIVAGVFGPDCPLRIDANAIWTTDEAIPALRTMRRFNISSVEQPVAARNLTGMRTVRQKTGLSIVADESLCSLEDARSLVREKAADIFNIRIAKCGGLFGSLDLVRLAQNAGLRCQLGTLVGETGILSCAAEAFGRRVSGFDFLEGKHQNRHLLVEDIVEIPASAECGGLHGLGLVPSVLSLERWAASPPTTFKSL